MIKRTLAFSGRLVGFHLQLTANSISTARRFFANMSVVREEGFGVKAGVDFNAALPNHQVVLVGQPSHLATLNFENLQGKFGGLVSKAVFEAALAQLTATKADESGNTAPSYSAATKTVSLYLTAAYMVSLPTRLSRQNASCGSVALPKALKSLSLGSHPTAKQVSIVVLGEYKHMVALVSAVARVFPLFSMKSSLKDFNVSVELVAVDSGDSGGQLDEADVTWLTALANGIRSAASIVDAPPNIMHTDALVASAQRVGEKLSAQVKVIQGEDLQKEGFGGIYHVGKASLHPPAMVCLSHKPAGAKETYALVGKGIVFDTGGMQIKGKTGMLSMKHDCGGAASVLHAFESLVRAGFQDNLHAVLCIAENMIGPAANRPDDVIPMLSGKTVEINNTDAEGRLVLADGVFYARTVLQASSIVDMATLTGAQRTATGDHHAAIVTNCEDWERSAVEAGLSSGDLVQPLVYCPELHFPELKSVVADMKNALVSHASASSSIAALFIFAHLDFDPAVRWLHVDLACPVCVSERGTGFGVALGSVLFKDHCTIGVLKAAQNA